MYLKSLSCLFLFLIFGNSVFSQKYLAVETSDVSSEWKGNTFNSSKTFYDNIENAPQFGVLSKILKSESLRKSIEDQEMVTIFAFSNEAFSDFSKETTDSIVGNSKLMNAIVKNMVVPGRVDENSLRTEVKKQNGLIYLTTLSHQKLGVKEVNGRLILVDSEGNTATITDTNFTHKNGFFHIVNGLIYPQEKE
ncbi:MAG: fasciclin domain-containing protein [Aequorivita sp.]